MLTAIQNYYNHMTRTTIPYRAVLFDLDGTLLDTLEDMGDAMNRVLSARGFPHHSMDAYRSFVGDGAVMLVIRALPDDKRDDETVRSCLEAYREDYGRNWHVKTRLYDGVADMLDALTTRGLKRAVLSNKPEEFTRRCVVELLSRWSFDVVLGEREGVPLKPDPTAAWEIAHTLDCPAESFLYLGDSLVDMQTAIAAGMVPVGALWGFRRAEELRAGGARSLIKRPLEILVLLD
jgi:phosphoglycolate phosphatase